MGDTVYARNFEKASLWFPGEVIQQMGPLSFNIQLEDNRVIQRHVDSIFDFQLVMHRINRNHLVIIH